LQAVIKDNKEIFSLKSARELSDATKKYYILINFLLADAYLRNSFLVKDDVLRKSELQKAADTFKSIIDDPSLQEFRGQLLP
jgi:hypothetical protein